MVEARRCLVPPPGRGAADCRASWRSISRRLLGSEMTSKACWMARNRDVVNGFLSGWYLAHPQAHGTRRWCVRYVSHAVTS